MASGIDRIDLYLGWNSEEVYTNTAEENELVSKFQALYTQAESVRNSSIYANPSDIRKWRDAYMGILATLDRQGQPSKTQGRQIRKLIHEFIEAKVDNEIPQPKMIARHKPDLRLVSETEDFLKYNMNNSTIKYLNDQAERAVMTDGTIWYKVWWDNLDNTYEHSGNVKIDVRYNDQIVPQPGVKDWRKLEYIFEIEQVSISQIYDVYGRLVAAATADNSEPAAHDKKLDMSTVTVVNCYYLNSDRIVGKFSWVYGTLQVICNEEYWQIRKVRKCRFCDTIVPVDNTCPLCGHHKFKYDVATEDILPEDLEEMYNPYEVGETDDEDKKDEYKTKLFLAAGTQIPFYQIRQLPFIPRVNIASIDSIYGISDASLYVEMQDVMNKCYTKLVDKTLDSTAILVKDKRQHINNDGEHVAMIDVNSYEEAESMKVLQVAADTQNDIMAIQLLYESAKGASGITEAYQGKEDATATSGKAKEFSASQSAGRLESYKVMKAAAFSAVYEMMLKFLLAFSDEPRKFVKVLPDGNEQEETWNKYSFLAKTDDGDIYYRDDFNFETDPAATLSGNRVAMWQEIQSQFINGALGNPSDDRTLQLFWNLMDQQQYPVAKGALAGVKDNAQHLPPDVEQLLLQNPEVLQQVMAQFQQAGMMKDAGGSQSGGQGGARAGAGAPSDGATKAANTEQTNNRNRANNQSPEETIQQTSNPNGVIQ